MSANGGAERIPSNNADSLKPIHACQLCGRTYERADHLNRHLDSHRNERSFKCTDCPRAFNRRDLLIRHRAAHAKNAANGKAGPDRPAERAIRACDACVISKLKCDNSRPCQRCKRRKIGCQRNPMDTPSTSPAVTAPVSYFAEDDARTLLSPPDSTRRAATERRLSSLDQDVAFGVNPASHLPDSGMPTAWHDVQPFPSFFEQIMAPDFVASDNLNLPPDIFNLMPDKDWFSDTTDIFGLDFTPTVDQAIETQINNLSSSEQAVRFSDDVENAAPGDATDSARRRHAIFLRSQFLWKPEANSHAFSEHRSLPLDETQIDMANSPHQPFLPSLILQDTLSDQCRDGLFHLVLKTAKTQISIPRFPSTKCLNILLKVGLAKRMETDAWIHLYTFNPNTARPELLIALIAAGCVCFGIPSVSKTGLVLFEIVRVALNRLIEDDNSVIRDLQYLQACMIWIEITAFCGFKRKMEIAEHSLQPLVTALRRAGKFDRVSYDRIVPLPIDEGDVLERKWRQWTEQESYKRLVNHLFEHDMYTATTKLRQPLISYAEMSLPLPACRDLWLAPSPEIWQLSYVDDTSRSQTHTWLSPRDLLADSELLRCLPEQTDAALARAIHLYGLAAQSWEYHQQSIISHSPFASNDDPSFKLWMQSRHQKLYEQLKAARHRLQDGHAVTALLSEFLMVSLHVNPDHVTRFAGKCGEVEAHRAYQELQPWSQSKTARTAVWHAAQVIRLARAVLPYQLRGADAFIIYHSIMVLWTYGMLQRDAARRSGNSTPNGVAVMKADDSLVYLDAESSSRSDSFVRMGSGRPCLRFDREDTDTQAALQELGREWIAPQPAQTCDLRNPQAIMTVGIKVFERNYPNETRQNLPQMIRSFCELMRELGGLT